MGFYYSYFISLLNCSLYSKKNIYPCHYSLSPSNIIFLFNDFFMYYLLTFFLIITKLLLKLILEIYFLNVHFVKNIDFLTLFIVSIIFYDGRVLCGKFHGGSIHGRQFYVTSFVIEGDRNAISFTVVMGSCGDQLVTVSIDCRCRSLVYDRYRRRTIVIEL